MLQMENIHTGLTGGSGLYFFDGDTRIAEAKEEFNGFGEFVYWAVYLIQSNRQLRVYPIGRTEENIARTPGAQEWVAYEGDPTQVNKIFNLLMKPKVEAILREQLNLSCWGKEKRWENQTPREVSDALYGRYNVPDHCRDGYSAIEAFWAGQYGRALMLARVNVAKQAMHNTPSLFNGGCDDDGEEMAYHQAAKKAWNEQAVVFGLEFVESTRRGSHISMFV